MSDQKPPTPPGDAPQNHVIPPAPASQASVNKVEKPWYLDPPKVAGVFGFLLALATVGERLWVREQQLTLDRLQQLREITGELADIQLQYWEALARSPSNMYALGVATNTKRQMLIQTASSLLSHNRVRRETSAQIFGALAVEEMNDGRYENARAYFHEALEAAGGDGSVKPYLLRSLAQVYRVPGTTFADPKKARQHFEQALAILDRRLDEAGRLSSAETLLTEASVEVVYGDTARVKMLVAQARDRMRHVRTASPLKIQLERLAQAFDRGDQYLATQLPPPVPTSTTSEAPANQPTLVAAQAPVDPSPEAKKPSEVPRELSAEIWAPVQGQVSGAEMDVIIDGAPVGRITNLVGDRQLKLRLAEGVHSFNLANMKAYFIGPGNSPSKTGEGFSCAGLFKVSARTTTLKFNIGAGANGMLCALTE